MDHFLVSSALVGELDGLGGNGQVVSLGLESVLIGGPGQSDLLALGRDVVRGSLVGVSAVVALAVTLSFAVTGELLLDVGLVTGRTIRTSISFLIES